MAKSSKSEALKKHLGNVVCSECGSKKHKTKEHKEDYDEQENDTEKKNKKEINGDQD